ncbi:hypothetical protein FRC19_011892 [Serendipita sp. 401]|nr:hypothetical protein FRC19_011892 [Serendipita sp. 401]
MDYFSTPSTSATRRPQTMRTFHNDPQSTVDARSAQSAGPYSAGLGSMSATSNSTSTQIGAVSHLGPHRTITPVGTIASGPTYLDDPRRKRDRHLRSLSPPDPTTTANDPMEDSGHRPMSWMASDGSLSSGRIATSTPQGTRSNAHDSLSRILARSLEHNTGRSEMHMNSSMIREDRTDSRMSWVSDGSTATNTVTTNTEPGWNFGSSTHTYSTEPSVPVLDPYFPPPPAMSPHEHFARSQQAFDSLLQHDPYLPASPDESIPPEMPNPSPYPPGTSTASTATNSQWWPTPWNFANSRHTPRPPTPNLMPTPHGHWSEDPMDNYGNPDPTGGLRPQSRLSTASDWDFFVSPARAMPQPSPTSQWPPFEVSSSSPDTMNFPTANRPSPRLGTDIYTTGPSYYAPARSDYSVDRYPGASVPASSNSYPSTHLEPSRVTVSVDSLRNGRAQEGSTRPRPLSPPPPSSRPSTLQSLLDRHARRIDSIRAGIPVLGLGHSRSISDSSGVHTTHSPPSPPETGSRSHRSPVERLSAWGQSLRPSYLSHRSSTSAADLPSSSSGASNSLYDHPSMRDLLDSHGHEQPGRGLSRESTRREMPRVDTIFGRGSQPYSESTSSRTEQERRRILSTFRRYSPPLGVGLDSPSDVPAFYSPASPPGPGMPVLPPPPPSSTTPWIPTTRNRQRTRETPATRLGRLLSMEYPLAWLGPDDDILLEAVAMEPEPAVEVIPSRQRNFARARAQRRARIFAAGRLRSMGDYVHDEDFDDSYEALMALGQMIGPAASGCSNKTLDDLQSGVYREFAGEKRSEPGQAVSDNDNCAICLEDYKEADVCVRLPRCSHLYHKECIKEWLKTAKTCPVCRETVEGTPRAEAVNTRRPSILSRAANLARSRDQTQSRIIDALSSTPRPTTSTTSRVDLRHFGRRVAHEEPSSQTQVERNGQGVENDGSLSRNSSTRRERPRRRLRQIDTTITTLGEFDTAWPRHSPPSPSSLWYFEPPSQMWGSNVEPSLHIEEPRFVSGPLTRALRRTGSIPDMMRGS